MSGDWECLQPGNLTCSCKNIIEEHKSVICCVGKKPFNHLCADLIISEIRAIKAKRGCNWYCKSCAELGNDILELKTVIAALKTEVSVLKQKTTVIKAVSFDIQAFEGHSGNSESWA